MKAELLVDTRTEVSPSAFAQFRVWLVPQPVRGSVHGFKYSLAYVVDGVCVMRYDNEAGKGDHHHIGEIETAYAFTTLEQLFVDFWADIDNWRPE